MDERTSETADPRDEIARLEDHIEQLEAKLDSCHKFAAASRFAMALGAVLLAGLVFGVIPFDPLTMTGAMAAGVGGVVTLGSNNATAKETADQLTEAEAERAELIGQIELRVVDGSDTFN